MSPTLLPPEIDLQVMVAMHRALDARQWSLLTRLGESTILLPAAAVLLAWLWRAAGARALAWRWGAALVLATGLVTASKIAFFGFEWGYARLNYTGLSGHAMYAGAVLPLLATLCLGGTRPAWRALVLAAAGLLAIAVAISRVPLGAHSGIEVIGGALVGAAVTAFALWGGQGLHDWPARRAPLVLPLLMALWLALMPLHALASPTHGWVLRLSSWLADRPQPYSRQEMLRRWYAEQRHRSGLQQP